MIKNAKRARRKLYIRKRLSGTPERPRLVVFRSLKHIYAQIIDDTIGKTLIAVSTIAKDVELKAKSKKTEQSFMIGELIGKKALTAGITKVAFDRAGYLYHGRIKALADGARKAGLEF
ncbi:MAG TPA: 50S ribosomal protein L18 [Candidatus Cloacimonadota bacterium]|nr:50S ribosomal protein L18 [Candidatus Cloacimonadota bacterium]HPT71645.1 50S ribosomal protein L18 [Candidatus Cloacimonadota bacterium]